MDSHSKSPPTIIVVLAVRGRVSIMSTRRPAHELRVVCCFVGLACATLRAGVLSVLHQCFHSIVLRRRPQRKEPVSPERRRQDDDNDHGVYLGVCVCVCVSCRVVGRVIGRVVGRVVRECVCVQRAQWEVPRHSNQGFDKIAGNWAPKWPQAWSRGWPGARQWNQANRSSTDQALDSAAPHKQPQLPDTQIFAHAPPHTTHVHINIDI